MRGMVRKPGRMLALAAIMPLALSCATARVESPRPEEAFTPTPFEDLVGANAESYKGKQVCVKGGLIYYPEQRINMLVRPDRINRPFSCTLEVPKFDPDQIRRTAEWCIRRYHWRFHPKIYLRNVPPLKTIPAESCRVICGTANGELRFLEGPNYEQSIEVKTIRPCPESGETAKEEG